MPLPRLISALSSVQCMRNAAPWEKEGGSGTGGVQWDALPWGLAPTPTELSYLVPACLLPPCQCAGIAESERRRHGRVPARPRSSSPPVGLSPRPGVRLSRVWGGHCGTEGGRHGRVRSAVAAPTERHTQSRVCLAPCPCALCVCVRVCCHLPDSTRSSRARGESGTTVCVRVAAQFLPSFFPVRAVLATSCLA